jgi:flagellar biosynthesis protein FlhB
VFKLAALGAVMMAVLWPERHRLESFLMFDPSAILGVTTNLTLQLMGAVVAMLAAVAIADYFFQYRQWFQRQRMSLQEIKDEFKQSEGDPHIKGKIRQLRQQRMKKRMMTAVPSASVIITNPTHYSVALSYDRGMSPRAPTTSRSRSGKSPGSTTFRSWRTCRWRGRFMLPSISTRRSRSSTITRSPRSSATSWD